MESHHPLPSSEGAAPRPEPLWVFALLALASLAMLAGCWDAGFTGRDDDRYVVQHTVSNGQAPLFDAFLDETLELYIPTVLISYRIDGLLFESWMPNVLESHAPGVRFMNWLYHVLAAWVLWRWVLPLLKVRGAAAAFVAALFLVHPVQTENVCWIAERKSVLSGLFGMLTLAAYLRWPCETAASEGEGFAHDFTRGMLWRTLSVFAFALCLGSKISGIGVVLVLAAWEICLGPDRLWGSNARAGDEAGLLGKTSRYALRLVFFGMVALPFLYFNMRAATHVLGFRLGGSWTGTLLSDVEILARYFGVLLWPPASSPYYFVEPITTPFNSRLWLFGVALVTPLVVTLWLPKSSADRRLSAFGWMWYFGAMVTYLNFVANSEYMHDRYLYLSLPGLGLALVAALRGARERWGASILDKAPRYAVLGVMLCAVGWAALSLGAGAVWSSEIVTFRIAAERQLASSFGHGYLGLAQTVAANGIDAEGDDAGEVLRLRTDALANLRRAVACSDLQHNVRRVQFFVAQATLLQRLGKPEQARALLKELPGRVQSEGWNARQDRRFMRLAEKMQTAWDRSDKDL